VAWIKQTAAGAFAGLVSTVLNGTVLWFVLELYRQLATSQEAGEFGTVHTVRPTGATLAAWQAVFYVTMVVSVCTTLLLAALLGRRFGAPPRLAIVFGLLFVGLVSLPFLAYVSLANECAFHNGFPFGAYCD
jgi:hypothetical protein